MAPGRIRVFVAGTIHANHALVRRFLEDDGYEVVGEAPTRENLVAAIGRSEPDAVVVDQDLLGRGMMARVRRAAPDARIIVFTAGPTNQAAAPRGADGYLEKGVGLAALTALLVRLFTDEPALGQPVAAGVAAAGAGRGMEVAAASAPEPGAGGPPSSPVGAVARLVTIASGAILIVWGLIAMIATSRVPLPPADTTDTTPPRTVVAASSLVEAQNALDELVAALRDGNYVLATVHAQTLMDERQQAIAEGFSLSGLDAAIAVRLDGLVGTLPLRVNSTLAEVLRSLYPPLPDEDQPGGGSGVVFGPTTGSGDLTGGTGSGTTGGDGGDGNGGGGGGGGGGGEDPGTIEVLGPGDGRAWGQSQKSDHTSNGHGHPGGAPGGGPPPWANGNANGHHKSHR
jgi:CheY-like chemotaxis protein